MNNKIYVGIDFGKKGGIVAIKGNKVIYKRHMPTVGDKESAEIDVMMITKILNKFRKKNCHVVAEKFGGFFGYSKKIAVSINGQKEAILAICVVLGIPYSCYLPTQWQKVIFEGTTVVKKKGKNAKGKDNKAMALTTANRLFPHEKFLKTPRCSVPHDGMIDAVLLAEFGRRKGL